MAVVESRSLEIWVQSGIPEDNELVFNVHVRNTSAIEWEVSYRLSQFGALDVEINNRTDALRDVAFPTISKETSAALVSPAKYKNKMKELEHCRMSLEQWVYYVVTRIEVVPDELKDIIEGFFFLPNGPDGSEEIQSAPEVVSGNTSTHGGIADLSSLKISSSKSLPIDADETTSVGSEYTTGSLDENGVPKKKKRKRIIKGAKRRLSNLMGGGKKKESFGVDFSGVDNTTVPTRPKATPSVVSAASSTMDTRSVMSDNTGVVQKVQPGKLLKVRVIRGGERSRGHPEYEIQLVYNPEKRPYTAAHVFSDFVDLKAEIEAAKGVGVGAPFPTVHVKSSLGMSLTEDQHAERTRMLDAWVKDLISSYQYMNDKERMHVRSFLNLDLSLQKDIYLQDKMANGMVEAPRAAMVSSTPSPLGPKVVSSKVSDSGSSRVSGYQPSFVSSRDDGASSVLSGGSPAGIRAPLNRKGSAGSDRKQSSSERRASYKVKIASTGSIHTDQPKSSNLRQKLDLKDMDGTVFTDEASVDSATNMGKGGINDRKLKKASESDVRGNRMSSLSNIEEERSSCHDTTPHDSGMLQENLLRIGMKDKKNIKKKSSCCVLM
mmetsp:Transcript_16901/g.25474  ORF Transcript_16901/g.25474 Transcript_16901/m.25474 type:complete len:604 (+) Transcript_16901:106-1917(+)|eukprot:CAMPEP_0185035350 /NCGR_PEP_ID=MMETSP1103-20130426/26567_1 /TAXON_ID=36769 /ORGANISM="Paraphysomonas bandaiensis, Strain Caron Lab Isolate" /LENGTH=603 /DNA_ID=CAMNT_0027572389 /DNA_START=41 /DNA_END=1852 /DNA_ORIENTATION=+